MRMRRKDVGSLPFLFPSSWMLMDQCRMEASRFSGKVRVLSAVLKVDAVCSATKDYRYSKATPLNQPALRRGFPSARSGSPNITGPRRGVTGNERVQECLHSGFTWFFVSRARLYFVWFRKNKYASAPASARISINSSSPNHVVPVIESTSGAHCPGATAARVQ